MPKALEDGRQCRINVAEKFFDKMCGTGQGAAPAPAPAAHQQAAKPARRYTISGRIKGNLGWANVRSHLTGFFGEVLGVVPQGEVFATYHQLTPWWRVRTAKGVEGYMSRKNFDLVQ